MKRVNFAACLLLILTVTGITGCGHDDAKAPEQFKGVSVNKDGSLGPPPEAERRPPTYAHP